jgi:hypothetical protein
MYLLHDGNLVEQCRKLRHVVQGLFADAFDCDGNSGNTALSKPNRPEFPSAPENRRETNQWQAGNAVERLRTPLTCPTSRQFRTFRGNARV